MCTDRSACFTETYVVIENCECKVREKVDKSTHVVTIHCAPQSLSAVLRDRSTTEPAPVDRAMGTVLGHGQLGHSLF